MLGGVGRLLLCVSHLFISHELVRSSKWSSGGLSRIRYIEVIGIHWSLKARAQPSRDQLTWTKPVCRFTICTCPMFSWSRPVETSRTKTRSFVWYALIGTLLRSLWRRIIFWGNRSLSCCLLIVAGRSAFPVIITLLQINVPTQKSNPSGSKCGVRLVIWCYVIVTIISNVKNCNFY